MIINNKCPECGKDVPFTILANAMNHYHHHKHNEPTMVCCNNDECRAVLHADFQESGDDVTLTLKPNTISKMIVRIMTFKVFNDLPTSVIRSAVVATIGMPAANTVSLNMVRNWFIEVTNAAMNGEVGYTGSVAWASSLDPNQYYKQQGCNNIVLYPCSVPLDKMYRVATIVNQLVEEFINPDARNAQNDGIVELLKCSLEFMASVAATLLRDCDTDLRPGALFDVEEHGVVLRLSAVDPALDDILLWEKGQEQISFLGYIMDVDNDGFGIDVARAQEGAEMVPIVDLMNQTEQAQREAKAEAEMEAASNVIPLNPGKRILH